jgi:hypothetical protein
MAQLSEEPLFTSGRCAAVSGGIELHGHVLAKRNRVDGVLDGDLGGAGADVVVHVRHGQGHGVAVDIGAVEGGDVKRQVGDPAGIAAAVIDLGRGDGGITRGIELHRDVLADGNWVDIVLDRHHGGAGADIAVHIGHSQVSVLAPTSEQTNAVWLKAKLAMAQLSESRCSQAAAVVLPFPVASSCTVTFWQTAIGLMVSSMVTWAVQVLTVVVHVRHGQGHGVAVDIGAVEGRDVKRQGWRSRRHHCFRC